MIPWNAFSSSEQIPDWRANLNDDNLCYYVASGPTQLKRSLDSPMLELAHERQFAIAQLGTRNVGFEAEHSARMQTALYMLDTRFTTHRVEEPCRPTSPHTEDLFDLRTQHRCFGLLPSLDISDPAHCESLIPSPVIAPATLSRSPLASRKLMEAALLPPSNLKRKLIDDLSPPIQVDDDIEDVDNGLGHKIAPPIKYARANFAVREGSSTRTRRGVRMLRSHSPIRHYLPQEPEDVDQLAKDGQLLLNLSRSRGFKRS